MPKCACTLRVRGQRLAVAWPCFSAGGVRGARSRNALHSAGAALAATQRHAIPSHATAAAPRGAGAVGALSSARLTRPSLGARGGSLFVCGGLGHRLGGAVCRAGQEVESVCVKRSGKLASGGGALNATQMGDGNAWRGAACVWARGVSGLSRTSVRTHHQVHLEHVDAPWSPADLIEHWARHTHCGAGGVRSSRGAVGYALQGCWRQGCRKRLARERRAWGA